MKNEDLLRTIHKRLRYRKYFDFIENEWKDAYDGFDMSGYGDADYHNLEILSRFKNYITNGQDKNNDRKTSIVIVKFWKGTCSIIKVNDSGDAELLEETSGESTDSLIMKILKHENPNLFE